MPSVEHWLCHFTFWKILKAGITTLQTNIKASREIGNPHRHGSSALYSTDTPLIHYTLLWTECLCLPKIHYEVLPISVYLYVEPLGVNQG